MNDLHVQEGASNKSISSNLNQEGIVRSEKSASASSNGSASGWKSHARQPNQSGIVVHLCRSGAYHYSNQVELEVCLGCHSLWLELMRDRISYMGVHLCISYVLVHLTYRRVSHMVVHLIWLCIYPTHERATYRHVPYI